MVPLEQLVMRHGAAGALAANSLRGLVDCWGILHLDWSFFPDPPATPATPAYTEFVARSCTAVRREDSEVAFAAGLVDRNLGRWPAQRDALLPANVGFLTERLYYADNEPGATHGKAIESLERLGRAGIKVRVWAKCYPGRRVR